MSLYLLECSYAVPAFNDYTYGHITAESDEEAELVAMGILEEAYNEQCRLYSWSPGVVRTADLSCFPEDGSGLPVRPVKQIRVSE